LFGAPLSLHFPASRPPQSTLHQSTLSPGLCLPAVFV
jgi:hypothetical protein